MSTTLTTNLKKPVLIRVRS